MKFKITVPAAGAGKNRDVYNSADTPRLNTGGGDPTPAPGANE